MKNLMVTLLLALLTCSLSSPASAQDVSDQRPLYEEAECPFDTGSLDAERLRCGYLTVPENRQSGSARTLRLAVAVMKAQASNPAPDPFVSLTGGPGAHALRGSLGFFDSLFSDRDVVIFDQRGTGYSEPGMCASLQATNRYIAALDLSEEEAALMSAGALRACRDAMLAAGVDLEAYSVRENAADLDDLREALGYAEWNLVGISYGALLAQAAMRDYPAGVRSAVLLSPAPMAGLGALVETTVPTFAAALGGVFEACEADAACRAEHADLSKEFYGTIEALRHRPLEIPVDSARVARSHYIVNAQDFVGLVHDMLYNEHTQAVLPAMIRAFSSRDARASRAALQVSFTGGDGYSGGMFHSAMCYDAPASRAGWESAASAHPALRSIGFWNDVCEGWHSARATSAELVAVESEIPVLVVSGDLDPVIEPRFVRDLLVSFPNAYHVAYPSGAHNPGPRSVRCTARVMTTFIADPTSPPDTSCAAEVPGIEFTSLESG